MKSMIIAFVAIAVLAVAADVVLDNMGFSTREQTSGPSTRNG
ncbi:hypothetical protein [Actibacterium lipolyticum]|uniref:Uncharacterized protein n=1 Tax=Actibacterium lipolyticum TaxID=1524263 RepID=A0A238KND0_9RHOB|nr:hypothetical protein [Actibacterium lipolyticum]SMX44305.1 hypothetical protein COL8621_02523 [Actibacterium lipolyticum]